MQGFIPWIDRLKTVDFVAVNPAVSGRNARSFFVEKYFFAGKGGDVISICKIHLHEDDSACK